MSTSLAIARSACRGIQHFQPHDVEEIDGHVAVVPGFRLGRLLQANDGGGGQASRWGFELEGNDGRGKMHFTDDEDDAVVGRGSLRFTPNPYPGLYATAIFPGKRDANWDLSKKTRLAFWLKTKNPNLPGFQNAGPVITLHGKDGAIDLRPAKEGNLLVGLPFSEARWTWMRVEVPLAGDDRWTRKQTGNVNLSAINAVGIALDSWGGDPFHVWLDGLSFAGE